MKKTSKKPSSKKASNEDDVEFSATETSIIAHLIENDIKTEDGISLDWKDHMFMFDVYCDMASLERDIVGLKAAQVTFTTTASNAVLWIAKNKHIDIIYTLPTFDDVRQFSGAKVNRVIAQNPIYQDWVTDKDTIEQKIVGDNIIHFRGTHTQKSATMVSSDLNVHDEIDASNQEVVEQYATRLQHSKLKRTWRFSHPSVPGNGVDKYWQLSDQKHWFIRCGACKKMQYLNWPDSIDMTRQIYQCKYCHAEITNNMRRRGVWAPKKGKASSPISGYWIPLLICPWVSAKEVIWYHQNKSQDYFYNKVLGLPYVGGGNKIMQHQIYQNLTQDVASEGRMVIGVDSGVKLRFVYGDMGGLKGFGECDRWEIDPDEPNRPSIEHLLKKFPRSIVVADQGGDIIGPRKLREKYPGRVFLAFYQRDKKTMQMVHWGDNDEVGRVLIDRDRMIQMVGDEFTDRRIPIRYFQKPDEWYDYWLHWSHIYRLAEEDKKLKTITYRWERSDRDDWVHATVYWRAGIGRFGGKGSVEKPEFIIAARNSYMVTPDGKTSSNPLKKVVEATWQPPEDDDWRNS